MHSSSQHSLVQASMLASQINSDGGRAKVHLRLSLRQWRVSWTSQNHLVSSGIAQYQHHMHLRYRKPFLIMILSKGIKFIFSIFHIQAPLCTCKKNKCHISQSFHTEVFFRIELLSFY